MSYRSLLKLLRRNATFRRRKSMSDIISLSAPIMIMGIKLDDKTKDYVQKNTEG